MCEHFSARLKDYDPDTEYKSILPLLSVSIEFTVLCDTDDGANATVSSRLLSVTVSLLVHVNLTSSLSKPPSRPKRHGLPSCLSRRTDFLCFCQFNFYLSPTCFFKFLLQEIDFLFGPLFSIIVLLSALFWGSLAAGELSTQANKC